MRKLYYLLIFIFSFTVLSAQEKLSKEEQARREKNIEAGNPFAKYGYKAKVATLSKGKYLEFHDLDSIVTIGTMRWHVDKNQIVGRIEIDTLNPDAQPIGDAPGRWMSPDPLSEEFPSYSPYNFCFNNPMRFVDPDGKAPLDHIFNANGRFIRDTGVGNAVKIQVGNKLLNPSQLSTSDGSKYAMRNIGAYYAAKIGADKGTKIGTGRNTKNSDANPAFTIDKTIYLNTNEGFSKSLDNISSFKNIMSHENNHKEDNENPKFKGSTLSNHADVYINQMSHETFSSSPDDYKVGTALSFGNYLLNMDQSGKFGQNEILDKIENFNNTNNGGLYIAPPIGNFSQGTLNLNVSHKSKNYPVEYKNLNE